MINSRKINDDEYLISWLNKYYVVNSFTLKLIDLFDKKVDVKSIASTLNLSCFKVRKLYKEIENQIKARLFYDNNVNLETPIKLQWKLTKKCNLKCKHCYLGELNNFEPSKRLIDRILEQILSSNIMEVTLSGGECLTCKYIDYIVNTLLKNNIKITIFTNGILLDKFINKINIENKNMLLFNVSIDGEKESHEKIRGKGTYNITINNIKYACGKGFHVTTATVINSINYEDIDKMIVRLKGIGVEHIQLSNIIIKGRAEKSLLISTENQKAIKEKLLNIYKEHPEYGYIYYSEIPDEDGKRKVYKIENGTDSFIGNDNWKCTAGLARVTINENGKVYCCPFLDNSYLGDINAKTLKQIWDNKKRFQFLDKLIKSNVDRVCIAIKQNEEIK